MVKPLQRFNKIKRKEVITMALITCPECGKEFSDKASSCPNCGCPTIEINTDNIKSFDDALDAPAAVKTMNSGSIKKAKGMIMPNESVLFASVFNVSVEPLHGKLNPKLSPKGKQSSVVVVSSKRVLCVNSLLGVGNVKEVAIKDISSIDSKNTLMTTSLRIMGITEMFVIDCNNKMQEKLMNALSVARK